jgi:MFS family permease
MVAGLGALLLRYVALLLGVASGQTWLYYVAIVLHGIIFGFFFVGGQVYVDKKAPPEIRAQAQGLIVLICFGVGMLVGTFFNVRLIDMYTTEQAVEGVTQKVYDWNTIWTITIASSVALLAAFALVFRDDVTRRVAPAAQTQEFGPAETAKA